jgi:outer membrane protein TolC
MNTRIRRITGPLLSAALIVSAVAARAQAPGTAEAFVREAIDANPYLAAYRDRVTAARAAARTHGTLPDPMLGFGYFVETPETRVGPQQSALTLSQRIPLGKLGPERAVALKSADIAEQGYREQLINLRHDVKKAFYEYFVAVEVTSVLEEERGVLTRMEEVARVRYASGLVRQQDVLKAQLAMTQVDDDLAVARRRRASAEAMLRTLLNRRDAAALPKPVFDAGARELPALETLTRTALDNRPEIVSTTIEAERAADARTLARRAYIPDLTLGAQYIQVGERDGVQMEDNGKDVFQVNAAINLPLWPGRRGAAVEAADADRARAQNQRASWETTVTNQVAEAYERTRIAAGRVVLYRDAIVPQARQTFDASESDYQTGEMDFLNLLDSERGVLAARRRYYEVRAEYGAELALLEKRIGTPLTEAQ